jgi:predicted nuclease with TOPRIM domain
MVSCAAIERPGLPRATEEVVERPLDEFKKEIKDKELDLSLIERKLAEEVQQAEDQNDISRVADLNNKIDVVKEELKNRAKEAPPVTKPVEEKPIEIPIETPTSAVSPEQARREEQLRQQWSSMPRVETVGDLRARYDEVKNAVESLEKSSLTPYEKVRHLTIVA